MTMKEALNTYCELYWWNMGKKTLFFKGTLKDLLKEGNITFTKRKSDSAYLYIFKFKNPYGITFKKEFAIDDFPLYAKQFIQMDLVRMGDKSQLYVSGVWRPTVTVNF